MVGVYKELVMERMKKSMSEERLLQIVIEHLGRKNVRIRMAQADCLKIIFLMASMVDPRYQIMANDVDGRIYEDWKMLVRTDYIRERFYALGGKKVNDWRAGDILFFSRHFTPVDHAGLALNEHEFVHLTRRGVCIDHVDKLRPVSAGRPG